MRTDGAAAQAAARRHYVSLKRGPDPAGQVLGIGPPACAEGLKYASGGEPDREDEGPHSRRATDRSTDREQDSSCERPSRLVDYQGHEAQNDDILDERRKQRMRALATTRASAGSMHQTESSAPQTRVPPR